MTKPLSTPTISIPIIGIHRSPLSQKFGIPRQPNLVDLPTSIELLPPYDTPDAFVGIESFSHLWISWQFHQNKPQANFRPQVRPPRLGGNKKLGVFATRSMYRPSGLGLSVVKLDRLEVKNGKAILHIIGADMLDATPIIDIKPYIAYSDSLSGSVNEFAGLALEKPTNKAVQISEQAQQQFEQFIKQGLLTEADVGYICQLIAQDPRPAYRQQEVDSIFTMRYGAVDVSFTMSETMPKSTSETMPKTTISQTMPQNKTLVISSVSTCH